MRLLPLLLVIAISKHQNGIKLSNAYRINGNGYYRTSTTNVRGYASPTTAAARKKQILFGSKEENDATVSDDNKTSSMMTLEFAGETVNTSKSVPSTSSSKRLRDFFALPQSAILLMRGSKNNRVDKLESIDAELLKQYRSSCDRVDALPPTPNDRFFDVTTSGVKFPGLNVLSVATIGVKMTGQDLPGYEFVLIRDSTYAEGNRLFVWFFNKVTKKDKDGNNDDPLSSNDGQTTFSLNKIRAVPAENNLISFESNAYLSVQIQFPSFLMKAIPGASKEKSEKTGSDSLRKVLDDDCPAALDNFQREYVRWLES